MEAIFIGTLDGIYKIVPAGGGWKIAGQDLAGANGALMRSMDGGATWQQLTGGLL